MVELLRCYAIRLHIDFTNSVSYPFKGVISTDPGSVWFGSVRNRSDFDASGSVNRKRVYGSVRDQSEPSS